MAKTERRRVVSVLRRNACEHLEVSLLELEHMPPLVELRRLFVPVDGSAPRPMERDGLALSVAVRHLPEAARAFAEAERLAVELGLLPAPVAAPKRKAKDVVGRRAA